MRARNARNEILATVERLNHHALVRFHGYGVRLEARGVVGIAAAVVLLTLLLRS